MQASSTRARVGLGALLVLASGVSAALAVHLADRLHTSSTWWPAGGLGVLGVLLVGRKHQNWLVAAFFVACTAGNAVNHRDLLLSSTLAFFDTVEVVLAVLLLRRYVGRWIDSVADLWRVIAIAALAALVAALGLAATLVLALDMDFVAGLLRTWPAHGVGVALLVPLVMTRVGGLRATHAEIGTQVLAIAAVTLITFGPGDRPTLAFAPLPFLVWAALRFGPRLVAVEQVAFAVAVIAATQRGWGPFPEGDLGGITPSIQVAQIYLLCILMTGLPLALAARQRDLATERLRASREVFRGNFTESRVAIALLLWDGERLCFSRCNDAAMALLGRESAELAGAPVAEVVTGADLDAVARRSASGQATGWSGRLGLAGADVILEGTVSPIQELEDGSYFSLHLFDVTGQVRFQERLQAEKDYTRAVTETAASMLVVTTPDGTITRVNPATTALTGFTAEELIGHKLWEDLLVDGTQEAARAHFASGEETSGTAEGLLRTKAGGVVAVVFTLSVYHGPGGLTLHVISAADVTAAREQAGLLGHLLRSATTIAFVGTDLHGRVTLFSTGAELMLRVSTDEATGRPFVDFLSDHELARHEARHPDLAGFEAVVGPEPTAQPETRDWTLRAADGTDRKVSMTANAVTDSFGRLIGYLFVARDVSDTRRSQQILIRALRREREVVSRLKELDRAKDDFVSTVSHELRTPMSSIIGSAEMLADGMLGEMTAEQRHLVEVIARNGDRLLALADDLLMLASADNGTWQQQGQRVDLRDVARESIGAVSPTLTGRRLAVHADLPEHPVIVHGDPVHLERALTNLLTNAVKFTPDGGEVTVTVSVRNGLARVAVRDTGIGIAPDELEAVFGKFFRSTVVQQRAIQGTGLGLSIVKTIVESHEGHVEVESSPGAGTTFTIILPSVHPDAVGSPRRSQPSVMP